LEKALQSSLTIGGGAADATGFVPLEVWRAPALFYLRSLPHRTLRDVVQGQRPLPLRYVVAIVSGIADALAAAAAVGVVHLGICEENIMVDDQEATDFEAEQRTAVPLGAADAPMMDYSHLHRRFERPPVAVVTGWDGGIYWDPEESRNPGAAAFSLLWRRGSSRCPLEGLDVPWRDRSCWSSQKPPLNDPSRASPELEVEWKRAREALEQADVAVAQAREAVAAAVQRAYCTRCV
jgi:hypothetical protein